MTSQLPPIGDTRRGEASLSGTLRSAGLPLTTLGAEQSASGERERDREAGGGVRPWDVPPKWDGSSPESQLEPYLRGLRAWLVTTRVPCHPEGVLIMTARDLRVMPRS
eukprot:1015711-Amphidinium_carterae.3